MADYEFMSAISIKTWPEAERPREKLLQQGVQALSDAELLAILFRSGTQGKDVLALAREIMTRFGGFRGLMAADYAALNEVKGMGLAKITSLAVCFEIAKRTLREEIRGKDVIGDPEGVVAYLTLSLRDRAREIFKILYLNKANRILDEEDLFEGTVDEAAVHPREVVRRALEKHATCLILVHNHPSGRIQPSPEDLAITKKLEAACGSVSIKILDHIIIGDNQYFSFRERGLLS